MEEGGRAMGMEWNGSIYLRLPSPLKPSPHPSLNFPFLPKNYLFFVVDFIKLLFRLQTNQSPSLSPSLLPL